MKIFFLQLIFCSLLVTLVIFPNGSIEAQSGEFTAIQAVPTVTDGKISFVRKLDTSQYSTADFLNGLFTLVIAGAALLVVIKLILAGVQYMFTDLITRKENAKKDIQNALLGLLVILASVTLLNTINPELTNLNALRTADPLNSVSNEVIPPPNQTTTEEDCDTSLTAGYCPCGYRYESTGQTIYCTEL